MARTNKKKLLHYIRLVGKYALFVANPILAIPMFILAENQFKRWEVVKNAVFSRLAGSHKRDNHTQMISRVMKKISNKFHKGTLTTIFFLIYFAGIASKLEKIGPNFQVLIHVHPCYPLQQTTGNSFNQERIKGIEKASPIHTLLHR